MPMTNLAKTIKLILQRQQKFYSLSNKAGKFAKITKPQEIAFCLNRGGDLTKNATFTKNNHRTLKIAKYRGK